MGYAPFDIRMCETLTTDVKHVSIGEAFLAHLQISAANAVVANTTGILAPVIDTAIQQLITTGLTNPSIPKNITATVGGTGANITAKQIIVIGTNFADEVITETLPAFTVATPGTVQGSKAFKTVTSIAIPAIGTGVTTSIGFGEKLGLPYKLTQNTAFATYLNNVKEATDPTLTVDASNIENNTLKLSSTLSGTTVDAYLIV